MLAREFMQRLARSLRDHAPEQSRRAGTISPMRARCIDDVPLQNIAIAIRRIVHRGFTIARIGIDEATLVPIGAHRHRQHVLKAVSEEPVLERLAATS